MFIAFLSCLVLFGVGFFFHSVARDTLEATLAATLTATPFILLLSTIAFELDMLKVLMKK